MNKRLFKIEIQRAFKNFWFLIALAIGLSLVIWYYLDSRYYCSYLTNFSMTNHKQFEMPPTALENMFCLNVLNVQPALFYLILPLMASLPFADSFCIDKNSGFIKNVAIRCNKKKYLKAKYAAVFISAMVVTAVPLVLSIILAVCTFPNIIPIPAQGNFKVYENMWGSLFYFNPYIYLFLYIFIDCIFSGLLACIALFAAQFAENRFIVLLTPFITAVFLMAIGNFFPNTLISKIVPSEFMNMSQSITPNGWIMLAMGIILFAITWGIFVGKGSREDVY